MSGPKRSSHKAFGSGHQGGKPHKTHVNILRGFKLKLAAAQKAGTLPMKKCVRCANNNSHKPHTCGDFGQKNKNKALLRKSAHGSVAGHNYFQAKPRVHGGKAQAGRQNPSLIRACSFACSTSLRDLPECCACSWTHLRMAFVLCAAMFPLLRRPFHTLNLLPPPN